MRTHEEGEVVGGKGAMVRGQRDKVGCGWAGEGVVGGGGADEGCGVVAREGGRGRGKPRWDGGCVPWETEAMKLAVGG